MAPLNSLVTILLRRANLSPLDEAASSIIPTAHSIVARDDPPDSKESVHFGVGATPADKFNNQGFLALFAILGAGMALTAIWFFFWAKNGGFKWRRGDWEDYKSTVLRRKGPDGRTLSNATKSTKLGGGSSIVGPQKSEYSDDSASTALTDHRDVERGDFAHEDHRATRDPELAHYRSERPARVGGMNRQHDGSHWDSSNTDRSAVSSDRDRKDRKRRSRRREERERERERHRESSRTGAGGRGSQRPPEMESLSSSYYSAYRPEAPSYRDDSDAGTKSYPCRIPGLSASTVSAEDDIAPSESVSNVGARRPPQRQSGLRRQGGMRIVRDEDGY